MNRKLRNKKDLGIQLPIRGLESLIVKGLGVIPESSLLIALSVCASVEVSILGFSISTDRRTGPLCRSRLFPRSNCHRRCCLKSIATAVRSENLQAPADASSCSVLH
jgi:hypothetical protein